MAEPAPPEALSLFVKSVLAGTSEGAAWYKNEATTQTHFGTMKAEAKNLELTREFSPSWNWKRRPELATRPMTTPHNKKLFIETVGCQMNMLDSELVVGALRKQGYELTSEIGEADTILFNTCSVRDHAEHKIYSALGRLKFSKQTRPNQVIGVMGCMAQKDQELIFRRAPHVDLVVGTGQLAEIPRMIDTARVDRKRALAVSLDRKEGPRSEVAESFQSYDPLREPTMRPSPYQAFVRIMIGCDKFCTYCVVPMTRGPEQSRSPGEILQEVRVLAEQGVKEVTLLGQTVNSYKYTYEGRLFRLSDLLGLLHDVPGILRLKFVTNYPKDMTLDLLQAIRDLPKCSQYLHVPLQSGCNEVLQRMKRGYTVEHYRDMMYRIRETLPEASVSSDFIAGFCGETEESHQRSLDLIRECRFKNSFIFKYSPRPGTKAFDLLPDDVPDDVKRRRNNELLTLTNQISAEDNAAFIGRAVEVLVEGPSKSQQKEAGGDNGSMESFIPRAATAQLAGFDEGSGTHNHAHEHRHDHDHDHDHCNDGGCGSEQLVGLSLPAGARIAPPNPATGPGQSAGPIQLTGRTRCDRIVVFSGNPRLAGSMARIRIEDGTPTTLIGSMVTMEYQHSTGRGQLPILS